ncbi:alpha-L-rhamnosidase N-terminal domain-containing protein [Alicyclobacillus fodiniaquatilis]|uniref:Alpha-L-rhamnosidase N-terminal domain-containing protein n=1 Tax=Alicyclobacillus fodiniaquatilis TaxID=1661150 RepID=A0ABW4JT73_9BACL
MSKPKEAKFVWCDSTGQGRNLFARFRKDFLIEDSVESAELNIFADTSYQLFINGQFLQFGPVRFDPHFPQYDTHDIAPYLRPGKNVIAVQVNYFGHKTFMSMQSGAGMIAWGTVVQKSGQTVELGTQAGTWKCTPDHAHGRYAPKASFALKAIDLYDQNFAEIGWNDTDFTDTHWDVAVELSNQAIWGELSSRNIPYMSLEPISISRVLHVLPLEKREDLYSFDLPLPFVGEDAGEDFSPFVAYTTWIYSPADQVVTAGVFYGETWINGEKLPSGAEAINKNMRFQQRFPLKKGWNHYFGQVNAYQDILHHYLALPSDCGLFVSAVRNAGSNEIFLHTPILTRDEYAQFIQDKPVPYAPDDPLAEIGGWVHVAAHESAQSPCRETSWDDYGEPLEVVAPNQLEGHVFSLADYPHGFSITFELDQTRLVLPELSFVGVQGATVDLTYSEHLLPDRMHLKHVHYYGLGDRMICSEDESDWLLSQPRGFRYGKITVRNTSRDVTVKQVLLRSANYPVELKGAFACSDPLFNEIWQLGLRTQAANMEDIYEDCPTRERGMYGRDTIIQYCVNLATFGDHALMRRCLELFGQSPDDTGKFRACYPNTGDYTISDFALNMLEGYRIYYEMTGDKAFIRTYWQAMQNNLAWFHELADERADLLLDSEWDVHRNIKAMYGGFHGDLMIKEGYMDNTGIHCVFSCVYLIALQSAVVLAEAIGEVAEVQALQRRIDILSKSIYEQFWNPDLGCYSDNLERTTHSVHASLFAVRAGVVDAAQSASIQHFAARELRSLFVDGYSPQHGVLISPSYAFYILDALYQLGMAETAERLIRQGWGWMLAQGLRTCPEYFDLNLSLCHAWSASPTFYLSKQLLGVHFPEAPNLDVVDIRVQAHSVTEAEGAFPHPRGCIEVKWHTEAHGRVLDYVKVPAGVRVGTVSLFDVPVVQMS